MFIIEVPVFDLEIHCVSCKKTYEMVTKTELLSFSTNVLTFKILPRWLSR